MKCVCDFVAIHLIVFAVEDFGSCELLTDSDRVVELVSVDAKRDGQTLSCVVRDGGLIDIHILSHGSEKIGNMGEIVLLCSVFDGVTGLGAE